MADHGKLLKLLLILAVASVLAGCGSKSSAPTTQAAPPSPGTRPAPGSTTAGATDVAGPTSTSAGSTTTGSTSTPILVTSANGYKFDVRALTPPTPTIRWDSSVNGAQLAPPGKRFVTFTVQIVNATPNRPAKLDNSEGFFDLAVPRSDARPFGGLVPPGRVSAPGPALCPSTDLGDKFCAFNLSLLKLAPEESVIPMNGVETEEWVTDQPPMASSAPLSQLRLYFVRGPAYRPGKATLIPWPSA
jgi:hypothetical protein